MFFRNVIFFIAVFLCINNANALLLNHSNASDSDDNSRLHRHHISSKTKQATKIAACATVGKGICLGVGGVKYIKKEVSGTTITQPVK